MKVGILYIGLGEYIKFWDEFYKSSEENFLLDFDKQYFIFTDNSELKEEYKKIKIIRKEDEGWPDNTLKRFEFFKSIETELKKFDYLYFFNSNYKFIKKINLEDILPTKEFEIVALTWNRVNNKKIQNYPYERNKKSRAYIPYDSGEYYFQGGLNGGEAKKYLELINECYEMYKEDFRNNSLPLNNDEAYLNKILLDKSVKILNENLGTPEEWGINEDTKGIFRKKEKILGDKKIKKLKKELNGIQFYKNKIIKYFRLVKYKLKGKK